MLICCSPCVLRTSALRAALADHEDVEVLRQLCAGDTVPEELRCELWKELLGVSRRPDAIGSWSGPLDCSNQELIHQHCQEQAGEACLEEATPSTNNGLHYARKEVYLASFP